MSVKSALRICVDINGSCYVSEDGPANPSFDGRFLMLDTCILFPAMLGRRERTLDNVERCDRKLLDRPQRPHELENQMKLNKRRVELINAIEDGTLHLSGYHFSVTDVVASEALALERKCGQQNINKWLKGMQPYVYRTALTASLKNIRSMARYAGISRILPEDGDFSVAMSALLLGCCIASDDYNSFNTYTRKVLGNAYSEKWGGSRKLSVHDSESVLYNALTLKR